MQQNIFECNNFLWQHQFLNGEIKAPARVNTQKLVAVQKIKISDEIIGCRLVCVVFFWSITNKLRKQKKNKLRFDHPPIHFLFLYQTVSCASIAQNGNGLL